VCATSSCIEVSDLCFCLQSKPRKISLPQPSKQADKPVGQSRTCSIRTNSLSPSTQQSHNKQVKKWDSTSATSAAFLYARHFCVHLRHIRLIFKNKVKRKQTRTRYSEPYLRSLLIQPCARDHFMHFVGIFRQRFDGSDQVHCTGGPGGWLECPLNVPEVFPIQLLRLLSQLCLGSGEERPKGGGCPGEVLDEVLRIKQKMVFST
jgi:hypothetical protein